METETSVRVYGTIGTLHEFNIHHDDWVIYKEKLDQYFLANLISDDRRVSVLLTLIGTDAYKVLRDLCDPDLPHSKSYDALCKLLEEQFSIKVSVFRKRIQFYNERQSQTESIRAWYVRIKNASIDCKFGRQLTQILTDKFVTGLKAGPILDRLCEEDPNSSLEHMFDIACKKEASLQDSKCMTALNAISCPKRFQGGIVNGTGSVHRKLLSSSNEDNKSIKSQGGVNKKLQVRGQSSCNLKCFYCGKPDHEFKNCRYKTYKCKNCQKVGHLAIVCRQNSTHLVEELIPEIQILDMLHVEIYNKSAPLMVPIMVGDKRY